EVDARLTARAAEGHTARLLAEAHDLRVRARARREALRPHVHGLEQVRLAGAVRPGHEHETRLQRNLEACVRADVAQRNAFDDQPASLIGMIKYQKSSPSAVIRPGRNG